MTSGRNETRIRRQPLQDDKSKLLRHVQILVSKQNGRTATGSDLEYQVQVTQEQPPMFQATVSIPGYEGGATFVGEVCSSKKKAEASAAAAALTGLEDFFAPLMKEHLENLRRKREQW